MNGFAIAGMQLPLSTAGGNLAHVSHAVDHLMLLFPWVQMVVLSELAVHGPSPAHAEPLPGPSERGLQAMAQNHHIWLVSGSLYELAGDDIYNTCSVISPEGKIVGRYRKIFPFHPYNATVKPGSDFLVFDVPHVGRFGVSICYDIWFPEHARTLACMGAEVILHPVMTATIDRDVELAFAQSTAAANQCYVVSINGAGAVGVGRSIIVGPDARIIHQAGDGQEYIPVQIDLDQVRESRRRGLRGLGHPLKSFRDTPVHFSVYDTDSKLRESLVALGPVAKPGRPPRTG